MRVEVTRNSDRRAAVLILEAESTAEAVLKGACNKFRLKPKKCRLFCRGSECAAIRSVQDGDSFWLLLDDEVYQGPKEEQFLSEEDVKSKVTIIDGEDVWIDPEAVDQVHNTVRASAGIILKAVGMPDLHHGPTGVAILARSPLPKLPGYDIGCGMALFRTRIPASLSRDRVARCMSRLDLDMGEDPTDPQMGTIGGGNHFAELLVVDTDLPMSEEVNPLINPKYAVLLVHSGSRAHGERVFSMYSDGSDPEGYMREHERLVCWARTNRATIARRFLQQFAAHIAPTDQGSGSGSATPVAWDDAGAGSAAPANSAGGVEALIDIAHNWIEKLPDGRFLHRKGAAPSLPGSLSLLPGSRATSSYVLVCSGDHDRDLHSVAHGAGRRLSRADARRHGGGNGGASGGGEDPTRGGTVVCASKDLLMEEGAHAYKDVEAVVRCMVARGMCRVGARLLPVATYKTRTP